MQFIREYDMTKVYREDISKIVISRPFPHMIVDNFLDSDLVSEVDRSFFSHSDKSLRREMGGRYKLLREAYQNNHKKYSQSLKKIVDVISSDEFAYDLLDAFEPHIVQNFSLADTTFSLKDGYKKKYYIDYDISIGHNGYSREIHRDLPKRLIVFLIYVNDSQHDGGELCLYDTKEGSNKKQQNPSNVEKFVEICPERNKMVAFLSNDISYHSVNKIANCKTPRKFIYGAITKKDNKKPAREDFIIK